jgi:hypothetical protein
VRKGSGFGHFIECNSCRQTSTRCASQVRNRRNHDGAAEVALEGHAAAGEKQGDAAWHRMTAWNCV